MDLAHPLIELRQYTLHAGTRDTLARVFDEQFIESQERHGMQIIGQFRDLERPDRFVWMRAFPDAETRWRALEAFYSGPVWKKHGPTANATMINHTNVLLLRPASPGLGFRFDPRRRPPLDAPEAPAGVVVVTISHLAAQAADAPPAVPGGHSPGVPAPGDAESAPGTPVACLVTEPDRQPFARLP